MKTYHLLIAILFFASCNRILQQSESLPNNIQVIDVNESDIIRNGKLSDLISIDSLVFLEYTDESLIGTIDKVIVSDKYIYIVDKETTNAIYRFDRRGNFLNSYKKRGRGPQEYLKLNDVSIFQDNIYVSAEPNQFFVLDKNLTFVKSVDIKWTDDIPLPQFGHYFSIINSDTVLFYHPSASYHYHLYDLNKEAFVSSQIKRRGTFDISDHRSLTRNASGKIYLSRNYNDTIYTLRDNRFTPEYIVNFEQPMTDEEIKERLRLTVYNAFKFPPVQKMHHVNEFINSEDYISFEFVFKRQGYFYFYHKEKNSVKIFNNSLENDFFLNPTIGHYQNSNITYMDVADLLENRELLSFSIPDNLTYDSNPPLVFYKPKFE